ncbi:hypothetical protein PAAG_07194 [Paracoccidioides lutzii Pb01]|uniref:Uncharacterized protein n=1 Tax=Paracoccidioides lutzii (strain ATCC MYA-826 / Pb01) TaxID=502779 RepID=C1H8V3_PARBA|nr:hypothetical protein PAAG_07194 [Paracoccidioides lutzii Pb01]EEH36776.2 hypothetical protein PAAG_07194 [Paracoccidioides lutzii Pb01]
MHFYTLFVLFQLLLAASGISAAAIVPRKIPASSLSPTLARQEQNHTLYRLCFDNTFYAFAEQAPSGIWIVGVTYKDTATLVYFTGVGEIKFLTQPERYMNFDNDTMTTGIRFVTLTTTPGITGLFRDNQTGEVHWLGASQKQTGWILCYMWDEEWHLFFDDSKWLSPPSDCFSTIMTAEPVIGIQGLAKP